jgi:23S rRNA pseudouridine1911/1915/1917 synthase
MFELNVIHEDDNLLVVDKPTGLVVHEGSGETGETLVDLLAKYLPDSELKEERYGLVHRLDKETSGLLLVAKTSVMFEYLQSLFKKRNINKAYLVLVEGKLAPKTGVIDIPLKRDMVEKTKFSASNSGKASQTQYEVIEYINGRTYLRAMPHTGRTHQIRVHFASLKHPVVGDDKYNPATAPVRLFLHSHQISFTDMHGKKREFVSELPNDLKLYLDEERTK